MDKEWTKNVGAKGGQGNSYRAVIGFCRKRLLQGLGCTERASQLLSCGDRCFIEVEQHTGQKFLPQRSRIFCASDFFTSWLLSLAGGICKVGAERRQSILPWGSRILGLVAFQETWLHRRRFPASFLW